MRRSALSGPVKMTQTVTAGCCLADMTLELFAKLERLLQLLKNQNKTLFTMHTQ